MPKAQLIRQYIEAHKMLEDYTDTLSDALKKISSSNDVFTLIPEDYYRLVDNLAKEAFTAEVFDWVNWYLYEKPKGRSAVTLSGVDYGVETVDDLIHILSVMEEMENKGDK
jgi:hypothetical protein